jgi:hypothetical protein
MGLLVASSSKMLDPRYPELTPSADFKTLFVSVRPGRVAVLVNSADSDWMHTCVRVLEFLSTVWGGKHSLILPTNGATISETFWQLLEAFDPDYIYYYRKTMEDKRRSEPASYEEILKNECERHGATSDEDPIRNELDRALRNAFTEDFNISPELQEELKFRVAPLFFEQDVLQIGPIVAASSAHYPLTSIEKIVLNCEKPTNITQIKADLPEMPPLWHIAATGQFNDKYAQALRDNGLQISEQDFSTDPHGLFSSIFDPPDRITTPFGLSMLQLGSYRSRDFQYWNEPAVVVVGDSLEDFCLYQNLTNIRSRVSWLPFSWIATFQSAANTSNANSLRLSGPELYAHYFAHQLLNIVRLRNHSKKAVFVSQSLNLSELDKCRELLNEATLVKMDFDSIFSISESRDSIASLIKHPIAVYETGGSNKTRTQQFVNHESPGLFETPKPTHFSVVNPYEHRWLTEISVKDYMLPRHADLGTYVARSPALTSMEARIGQAGITYFCPNLFIGSPDVDQVLVRPTLYLPDALELAQFLAGAHGYRCAVSDKGYFLSEAIRKFGGIDRFGLFLRQPNKHAVLDKYLDKNRPSEGVTDEGVFLSSDRRRYLDFSAIQKILGTTPGEVSLFVDDLIKASILYRGFIFKCAFCRNADWFSVDELSHEFKCKRCAHAQIYATEHWLHPQEPAWFYKLDEIIFQGHSNNMNVPALTLCHLNETKTRSFLHTTELNFFDRVSDELIMELDIFCVKDGVLAIGEAKKEDKLGDSASDDEAACLKYLKLAKAVKARVVIFATGCEKWSRRTSEQIAKTFASGSVRYQLFAKTDLFS